MTATRGYSAWSTNSWCHNGENSMKIKGRITRQQTVWCFTSLNVHDDCEEARRLAEANRARGLYCKHFHQSDGPVANEARAKGWIVLPTYGWICPTCRESLQTWKRTADHSTTIALETE
jgi:hypothetical protein